MDSCVIHLTSDHFTVLHNFELCIFTGIVLQFFCCCKVVIGRIFKEYYAS